MTNHEPWEYQTHITDEWERDTMVVQVRQIHRGHTSAIGQVLEDRDGMAVMDFRRLPDTYDGREHLEPTPGIRLRHDVAVSMARAILTEAGRDADRVEELERTLADVEMRAHESAVEVQRQMARADDLQNQVTLLERLVATTEAHADREARVADHFHESLEHQRRDDRHDQARRHHPAGAIQDRVNDALARMARVQEAGTFPQKAD